jgi:hypothetical protein
MVQVCIAINSRAFAFNKIWGFTIDRLVTISAIGKLGTCQSTIFFVGFPALLHSQSPDHVIHVIWIAGEIELLG